jgi:hypothetical protein
MSIQRFDRIFKQRLSEGTMPVPEHLWAQLEPFLPSPRKRNRWGLIWIIGSGVVIVASLIWRFAPDVLKSEQLITTELSSLASVNPTTVSIQTDSADTEPVSQEDQQSGNSENKGLLPFENINSANAESGNSSTVSNRAVVEPREVSVVSGKGKEEDILTSDNPETLFATLISRDESVGLKMKEEMLPSRLLLKTQFLALPGRRKLPDPAKDCYSFGRKGSSGGGVLFAEAYAGPTVSLRKLSSRTEDVSTYIAQRDSTESSRLSWHAGLRVGYWHHSGITARIGGHYTQVNERFDFVNGSFVGAITRIDTIYDGGGNITDFDTIIVPVSGQRIVTWHNRYHTIDIPLLLGYQVSKNHWTFGIQAGPVFNVAFIKKGRIPSPVDGNPIAISDKDVIPYHPVFKDKLGLSIYGSAHIAHRIGYRTSVYAEPYLQHRLKTLTLDSYPVDQRQTNIGLSIGLRFVLQ